MPHGANAFLLELFLIFVCAKLFAELFERLSLPAVLGEILAGTLFGPHLMGLIHPSATTESLAEIGAIFLLFTVGLETRPADLLRVGRRALEVAVAGVVAPFALGFGYLYLKGGPLHETVFISAAMVATSVGITARVLSDLHALNSRESRIILGAAVFDDILGMVVLAVAAGMASGGPVRWLHLGILTAEAAAFAVFMIFIGPRLVGRIRPGLKRMSSPDAPLVLSLAICLGLSVAATQIGMAAIIGAFFAGLVFADYAPEWNLQPRAHAIVEFLAPFFFFVMGAHLDPHLFTGSVWVTAVILSLLAIVSKVVGCGLPMVREGMRSAAKVGVGMMPRGEVALIVALIGLQTQSISQEGYAVVIFMAAVTTVLAPPFLRYLFRDRPRHAPPDELEDELRGTSVG